MPRFDRCADSAGLTEEKSQNYSRSVTVITARFARSTGSSPANRITAAVPASPAKTRACNNDLDAIFAQVHHCSHNDRCARSMARDKLTCFPALFFGSGLDDWGS